MQTIDVSIVLFVVLITALIFSLTVLGVTLLYAYKNNQYANHKEMEALKLTTEMQILASNSAIHENLLQTISREIHDHILMKLSISKMHLARMQADGYKADEEQVKETAELIEQTIDELHGISGSLNSDVINAHGFLPALEMEIERIRYAARFLLDFVLEGEPVYMDVERELIVFRIIQEGFNNILKHAQPKHVALTLEYSTTHLVVTIKDDGEGFDNVSHFYSTSGLGLSNMHSRTVLLGGELTIKTQKGVGTVIEAKFPLNTK